MVGALTGSARFLREISGGSPGVVEGLGLVLEVGGASCCG